MIRGEAGNDVIIGGAGKDTIQGDAGDDLIFGYRGADTSTEGAATTFFTGTTWATTA